MLLVKILFLSVVFLCIKGQTTEAPNHFCNENDGTVEFTWSSSYHSAWNPISNCSLQRCTGSSNNNNSCYPSSTICYHYHTHDNHSHCAPGILCSILEPCENITHTCASNTSICIINSCCSPKAVCLPLLWTNYCILDNTTSSTSSTTSKSTSTSSSTSSSTRTSTTTKSTTTITTTTTNAVTTTFSCSTSSKPASLATFSSSSATNWTYYTYNYTANKMTPVLVFGVDASMTSYIMIDDVSVVDHIAPSVELLDNPSFDNSSTIPPKGWSVWCANTCAGNSEGTIVSSGCQVPGRCYKSQCNNGGVDYVVQAFPAIINRTYTISFWFRRVRIGGGVDTATLYVGIL